MNSFIKKKNGMRVDDIFYESFDLKDYNLKKVNKKQIVEIFDNYDFDDVTQKKKAYDWLNSHNRIFGWIYNDYIVFYTHVERYLEWHFLNLNHLDTDNLIDGINSHEILNVVFNVIYNKMVKRDRTYSHIINVSDLRRFKLYKKIIEKVIKKHNIEYTISIGNRGLILEPIIWEGKIYS